MYYVFKYDFRIWYLMDKCISAGNQNLRAQLLLRLHPIFLFPLVSLFQDHVKNMQPLKLKTLSNSAMVTRLLSLSHIGACADVSVSGLNTPQLADILLHQLQTCAVMQMKQESLGVQSSQLEILSHEHLFPIGLPASRFCKEVPLQVFFFNVGPLSFLGGSGVAFSESSGGTGGTDEDEVGFDFGSDTRVRCFRGIYVFIEFEREVDEEFFILPKW